MDQPISAAALVPAFQDATERLRSGRLLDLPDALSLQQQLEAVAVAAAESATAAVAGRLLGHGSFPAALLDLLTAALRLDTRSCSDACSLTLEAHSELSLLASEAVSALVCFPLAGRPSPEALGFATRLLRTQTLQRYSRLLAAATEDVQAAGPPATQRAANIIGGAGRLVGALADAARCSLAGAGSEAHGTQQQQRALAFAGELTAALRYSCVAEHLARAALHVQLQLHPQHAAEVATAVLPLAEGEAYGRLRVRRTVHPANLGCIRLTSLHNEYCKAAPADGPAACALREVLGGRCVRHLALSSALAALCAADGGPSYGLPEKLLLGLPVLNNDSGQPVDLRQRHGVQQLHYDTLALLITTLHLTLRKEPTPPPPGRRAAVALLLRVGRLAVESGRAWAEADAGAARVVAEGGSGEASNSAGRPPLGGPCGGGSGGGSGEGARRVSGVPRGICSGNSLRNNSGGSSTNNGGRSGSGASGSGHAGSSGGIEGGGECGGAFQPQPLRLLVGREHIMGLARQSLEFTCSLLREQQTHREQQRAAAIAAGAAVEGACGARAGWEREAAAEWWRLAVAAALGLPRWASADQLAELAQRVLLRGLDMGYLPLGGTLPPTPPPCTAAALAAGVLPCFERLLRRAGEAPAAAEAALARSLAGGCLDLHLLAPLLAYGEPRQVAALVATVRKLLKGGMAQFIRDGACRLPGGLYLVSLNWVLAAVRCDAIWHAPGELPGAKAAAAGSNAGRQLAQVVSYAGSEWLPLLSRFCEKLVFLLARGGAIYEGVVRPTSIILKSLLTWVRLLAHSGSLEQGAVAAPAAAGGWRQWLLEDVRVVPLLGSALGLLPLLLQQRSQQGAPDANAQLGRLLGASCCCVAAAFPEEVRGAALSAAAAEGGVANRAAGASRSGGVGGRSNVRRPGDRNRARAGASSSSSIPSGLDGPVGWARAAAASGPGGWRPSLLCPLAAELRASGGGEAEETAAAAVADLAGRLEAFCAQGNDDSGGASAGAVSRGPPAFLPGRCEAASGRRVPPPAEARALLRTCANPACDNLAGGSEAELPLRACGRCGAAWYCRPECQTAHWRAGHREACGRQGLGGRAAGELAA